MARAITSPELALLRSDTQWSKFYLAIYKPNTIYTALLNGAPSTNDRVYQITFDGGAGTLANVKPNMTLYVGTSAGAYDLGVCRIRKAPIAGTFYIGLTSEIDWADNCYLTVVDDFDLWAKHATIDADVLSMDVDIAYSDQHSNFNPVPVLGPHAVVWLDSATVDVEFDGSDSWVIGSSITGHVWTAPGASATSGLTTATPTITYDTPGCYSVYDTVTAANGKSTLGVRHVFVYDRADNQPATVFQLSQCIGDHDTGGWMFDMSMEAEATLAEIPDRALVVLFAEDWYGTTKQNIGPVLNRENIVCVGRIVGESLRWDSEGGLVHFTVQGLQHWLNKIKTFPVDLDSELTVTSWSQMSSLTVDRVLWHTLYWHSTAIETMDFYPTNDARYAADGKTIAAMLWGQLQDIAIGKLFAVPGVDRFGRLFVKIDPQMVPEIDRADPVVMTLTDNDWQDAIDFQRVTIKDTSVITLNAEEADASGAALIRYSLSPGHVPLRYGEPLPFDRVLAASQAEANQLAGLALGWHINPFPDIPVVFAQNNRMFDVFPGMYADFSVGVDDTPRGIAFSGYIIPRRVAIYFDGDTGYSHAEINFEAETFEQISALGDVPESESTSMEIPSMPPIPGLPDLPDLDVLLPGSDISIGDGAPAKILVHLTGAGKGLAYTLNGYDTSPHWVQWNTGLTSDQYERINLIEVAPNGAVYVACLERNSYGFLARAAAVGGAFAIIEDYTSMTGKMSSTDNVGLVAIGVDRTGGESVLYGIGAFSDTVNTYLGSGVSFTAKVVLSGQYTNDGASLSYGDGKWLWTCSQALELGSAAAAVTATRALPAGIFKPTRHIRVGTSQYTIHWGASDIALGAGNAASYVGPFSPPVASTAYLHQHILACSLSGQNIMASNTTGSTVAKSTDYGYSWSVGFPIPGTTLVAGTVLETGFVIAGAYIKYTPDMGTTWNDKQGDITSIAAIPICDAVAVVA
jgi:hypothetical protein